MATPDRPAPTGAHLDFKSEMSYGDYLGLDAILTAQAPRSDCHDEMLFIVQHQTTELWMKLVLHELFAARAKLQADELGPAFKMLARVGAIMQQLIQAWNVLSTLTPSEYGQFRASLGHSSGFQSYQYRGLEFLLGNKSAVMMEPHRHRPDLYAWLDALLRAPSFYDEAIHVLARRGLPIDQSVLERDFTQPYVTQPSVEAAWAEVYRNTDKYFDLYELAEELVDVEDTIRQWRFIFCLCVPLI